MRGKNDEFYLVLTMKIQKKMKKYLKKVLTNHFSCAILFKRSRKTALEMPKCRAAARTVAPVSIMYTASSQARFSMVSVIYSPPMLCADRKTYALTPEDIPEA